jgi:UDP-N-acetylglucosamine/UDP-N-acetylgalactosamine 4-epimerase
MEPTALSMLDEATGRRWLVTGAAGFIGSHIVERLIAQGETVVGLDNFETGKRTNLEEVLAGFAPDQQARFELIEGDIRDLDACRRAAEGVTHVLHQAALGSVPRSIDDPATTNDVNVGGFINVLAAARETGAQRAVYASSGAVYGDSQETPKREGTEGRPLSPYGASKKANEDYAAAFVASYAMEIVGLRYFNVYGPRQDPTGQYASVIPRWIGRLTAGQRCTIYGDGSSSRDFIYVGDVARANIAAATGPAVDGVYNIAVGGSTNLSELYRLLRERAASATGRQEIAHLEPIHEPFRTGDIRESLADTSRARTAFGFAAQTPLSDGLTTTVNWFSARRSGPA